MLLPKPVHPEITARKTFLETGWMSEKSVPSPAIYAVICKYDIFIYTGN
jgi:hypothetical protein